MQKLKQKPPKNLLQIDEQDPQLYLNSFENQIERWAILQNASNFNEFWIDFQWADHTASLPLKLKKYGGMHAEVSQAVIMQENEKKVTRLYKALLEKVFNNRVTAEVSVKQQKPARYFIHDSGKCLPSTAQKVFCFLIGQDYVYLCSLKYRFPVVKIETVKEIQMVAFDKVCRDFDLF